LKIRRIAVKFVPRFLTNDQKQRRAKVYLQLREKANEDPTCMSISVVIKCDKSWIYGYDPKTK
jgi:hypothetical protein